ncbi:MAG TPA: copper transporter [Actinomycetota bacterium]|nr:copper transporter [Actinomycetota bacterium]
MVSFRFHLVSLVAVFLALGLGVLTGTTVINRGLVARLEDQTNDLRADADRLRADVDRLSGQVETWSAFGDEVMDALLTGRLEGQRVVVVAQEGTDDTTIDGVLAALRLALGEEDGALVGPFSVSGRMALRSEGDRTELASILGADPTSEAEVLQAQAANRLAQRLAFGAPGDEVLEGLIEAGFLVDEGPQLGEADLQDLGGEGELVLALAGGPDGTGLGPERFMVPLVSDLATDGGTVAAAEPATGESSGPSFVDLLRADGAVSARIATQDNVDQRPGQIGIVLALEDLARGVGGHYGTEDGATSVVPPV